MRIYVMPLAKDTQRYNTIIIQYNRKWQEEEIQPAIFDI